MKHQLLKSKVFRDGMQIVKILHSNLLVLTGIIVFLIAGTVLCFGFKMRITLTTH